MGGHCCNANGVTIGRCLGHKIDAQVATSTGFVVDDDHAQAVFHSLGQGAGRDINGATWCVGHHQANGLVQGLSLEGVHAGKGPQGDGCMEPCATGEKGGSAHQLDSLALSASVVNESAKKASSGKPALPT